jgi:hypothetical protein
LPATRRPSAGIGAGRRANAGAPAVRAGQAPPRATAHTEQRSARSAHPTADLGTSIDWRYQLLDATERRVFPRIVVFLGGGLLAQVEVVCQEDDEADTVVLDALAALVEHNLVRRDITEDGEAADARNDSRVRTRRAARPRRFVVGTRSPMWTWPKRPAHNYTAPSEPTGRRFRQFRPAHECEDAEIKGRSVRRARA